MTTSVTRLCFTTQHKTCKTKTIPRPQCARPRPRPGPECARPSPRPIFLVSDRSCSKTDGLRPHHCNLRSSYPAENSWNFPVTKRWLTKQRMRVDDTLVKCGLEAAHVFIRRRGLEGELRGIRMTMILRVFREDKKKTNVAGLQRGCTRNTYIQIYIYLTTKGRLPSDILQ